MEKWIRLFKRAGLILAMALLASLLAGCSVSIGSDQAGNGPKSAAAPTSNPGPTPDSKAKPAGTANQNPGSNTGGGSPTGNHRGPANLYPDPRLTPGDVFPGVTAAQVCTPGYSKSVRNVSAEEKAAVYQNYGIPDEPGKHEVDHFISLELGGSNNLKNLWPEPYDPKPGAHEKDTVENALHKEVCDGRMSLAQAQKIIVDDWYAYYLQIQNGG